MTATIVGKVLFANGAPFNGAEVRVFDRDAAGKTDDDLTTQPGLSNSEGKFQVAFEAARYMDMKTFFINTAFLPFDWTKSGITGSIPDLTDIYLPYLQFQYILRDRPRQYSAALAPFQNEFRLPENPPVQFTPSQHGFHFINSFPGFPLPFSIPGLEKHLKVPANYGLCGGMSAAAYDFILAGKPIPDQTGVPDRRSKLYQYIFRRTIDSFGARGEGIIRVGRWTLLPEDTVYGTQKLTNDQFKQLQSSLADQNPTPIALIYTHATNLQEMLQMIWNNHQVLAHSYTQIAPGIYHIQIYDPNFPGRDDVLIQAERVQLKRNGDYPPADEPVDGLKCFQIVGNQLLREVRGFFTMPYVAVQPPSGL